MSQSKSLFYNKNTKQSDPPIEHFDNIVISPLTLPITFPSTSLPQEYPSPELEKSLVPRNEIECKIDTVLLKLDTLKDIETKLYELTQKINKLTKK